MVCVALDGDRFAEGGMALDAHAIGLVREFERRGIPPGVGGMRVMATPARGRPLQVALGTHQGFNDESCLPEAAILVKALARKFPIRAGLVTHEKLAFR